MKKITKKAILMSVMAILIAAVGILVYQYDQPWVLEPDPNWEPTIASLDVTRERFFIQSGNVRLESELLIPSGDIFRRFRPSHLSALFSRPAGKICLGRILTTRYGCTLHEQTRFGRIGGQFLAQRFSRSLR